MPATSLFLERWKQRARQLKREVYALYLAYKDPRVPWYARLFAGLVVAYAFSPIDLIPDPIPILGYLDDLVLIPLGIALAIKLLPPDVLAECRHEAGRVMAEGKPTNWVAAVVIIAVWLVLAAAAVALVLDFVDGV
jgi:uncharacterized membrane protein YkvA (DUF1232 family)